MTGYSALGARWGLLLTTMMLGVTLVVMGVTNYLDARGTGAAMTRVEANDLLALRHDIRDAATFAPPVLDRLLAESEPRGARYIAVVAPDGVLAAAGSPAAAVSWQPPGPEQRPEPRSEGPPADRRPGPEGAPPPRREPSTGEGPPGSSPVPPLQRIPGTPLFRVVGWLEPPADPRRVPTPSDRRGPLGPDRATLVIDFEPRLAARLASRALAALVAQVVTTGVLLIAAVAFWRQSRRAEAASAEAERARHLRTLGEMSAVLGHELRNPLTALKGHAQLLLERLPAEHPGHPGAATIVGESVRLEALANQVLEFAKTGTLRIRDEDPGGLAAEAVESASVGDVHVAADKAPPSWPLDRERMVPVLVNLLKNARDASPDGAPVELRVAQLGDRLVLEVSDRGDGLSSGAEAHAFEPFFTTRVHGTGLGLALAKRVVEGHGGTIHARNREGGGAVFEIALPREPARRTA
jgi:two-component system sensor histidine kinase HydH